MAQKEAQIPRDYQSWKSMIVNQCGETLSQEFINARILVLNNANDPYTKKMREVYGDNYMKALMSWYERAKTDMN